MFSRKIKTGTTPLDAARRPWQHKHSLSTNTPTHNTQTSDKPRSQSVNAASFTKLQPIELDGTPQNSQVHLPYPDNPACTTSNAKRWSSFNNESVSSFATTLTAVSSYSAAGPSGAVPIQDWKHALKLGSLEHVQQYLRFGEDVNKEINAFGEFKPPISVAVKGGHTEVVKFLIEQGADVNQSDRWGRTPLNFACDHSKSLLPIVMLLVEHGAQMETLSEFDLTPFIWACSHGHLDVVQYLVGQGANVNFSNTRGNTPLHVAIHTQRHTVIEYLVEKGAHVSYPNNKSEVPLHIACEERAPEIVAFLLEHGAAGDVLSPDYKGETPYDRARGRRDIRKMLSQASRRESAPV